MVSLCVTPANILPYENHTFSAQTFREIIDSRVAMKFMIFSIFLCSMQKPLNTFPAFFFFARHNKLGLIKRICAMKDRRDKFPLEMIFHSNISLNPPVNLSSYFFLLTLSGTHQAQHNKFNKKATQLAL